MLSISDLIIHGSVKELETQLMQQTINLNIIDEYGFTPLIQCAIINSAEKGELLLDYGADVNMRDLAGSSALHWTVENSNIPFCHLLLNQGADANAYTLGSESVLVKPILRRQKSLRRILVRADANISFAQDYIHTKLLGHRFELSGFADIVDHKQHFTEVDFEGFILEFTIGIILNSLQAYKNNFSARHLRRSFHLINELIESFFVAAQLIRYQHYLVNLEANRKKIDTLLDNDKLIIPVAYEGHAISFVKYGRFLAKCDRSQNDLFVDNVVIYEVTRPQVITKDFLKQLMYKPQTKHFIDVELPNLLGLKRIRKLTIGSQISGNCSWANIESCVPVIWFLLSENKDNYDARDALGFYYQWLEWDKGRALHFCIQNFVKADSVRRASIAATLAAILFQRCNANEPTDLERAQKIVPILKTSGYEYLLDSYIEIYCHRNPSPAGDNLQRLLQLCDGY